MKSKIFNVPVNLCEYNIVYNVKDFICFSQVYQPLCTIRGLQELLCVNIEEILIKV